MSAHTASAERRQFGRRQSQMRGLIQPSKGAARPCTIENFSESGAMIVPREAFLPPARFTLTIERTGMRIECEVRHRNGTACGVRFLATEADTPAAEAPAAPRKLAYEELLSMAKADQEEDEFRARLSRPLAPGAAPIQRSRA